MEVTRDNCAFVIKDGYFYLGNPKNGRLKIGKEISEEYANYFIDNVIDLFNEYSEGCVRFYMDKNNGLIAYPIKPNRFGSSVVCRKGSRKHIKGVMKRIFHIHDDVSFIEHNLSQPIEYNVCQVCGRVVRKKYFQR